jgi:hypothetical protein
VVCEPLVREADHRRPGRSARSVASSETSSDRSNARRPRRSRLERLGRHARRVGLLAGVEYLTSATPTPAAKDFAVPRAEHRFTSQCGSVRRHRYRFGTNSNVSTWHRPQCCFVAEAALSARLLLSARSGSDNGPDRCAPRKQGCTNRTTIDLLVAVSGSRCRGGVRSAVTCAFLGGVAGRAAARRYRPVQCSSRARP